MELEEMLKRINHADAELLGAIMGAVLERKSELFPEWDIVYLSLPKYDWNERKRILQGVLSLEDKMRNVYDKSAQSQM